MTLQAERTLQAKEAAERLRRLEEILVFEFGREQEQIRLVEQRMQELEGSLMQARKLASLVGQAVQYIQEQIQAHERATP